MKNNSLINNKHTMVIILCTFPYDHHCTSKIIKTLLSLKLAACITTLNQTQSFYYWNSKLEKKDETQLMIKTKRSLIKLIFSKIKEIHPYQIPEFLTLSVKNIESNYLTWIYSNVK